jgi:hypothetical protein
MADYIRDLRPAKWGSGVSLHSSNLNRSCPLWVKSRHWGRRPSNVRFTPKSGHWKSVA